jgi:hypothetical protein
MAHLSQTTPRLIREVLSVRYHRNGISGIGFCRVDFIEAQNGERLIGIVAEDGGFVGVIDPTDATSRWRGNDFAAELHEAIESCSVAPRRP